MNEFLSQVQSKNGFFFWTMKANISAAPTLGLPTHTPARTWKPFSTRRSFKSKTTPKQAKAWLINRHRRLWTQAWSGQQSLNKAC